MFGLALCCDHDEGQVVQTLVTSHFLQQLYPVMGSMFQSEMTMPNSPRRSIRRASAPSAALVTFSNPICFSRLPRILIIWT